MKEAAGRPAALAVTAVVIGRNGLEYLPDCLSAVSSLSYPVSRAIFVDDASQDGSADWVRARRPGVEVLELERRRGPGGARNAGISRAGTPLVFLLDCDGRPAPDTLGRLVEALHETPGAAAAAPRVMMGDTGVIQHDGGHCHVLGLMTLDNSRRPAAEAPAPRSPPYARSEAFGSTCILINKDKAAECGLFDEDFDYPGEDLDFTARLRAAGHALIHVPDAIVRHVNKRLSSRDYLPSKMFFQTRNRRLFALKVCDAATLFAAAPLHFLYEACALALALREGLMGEYLSGWISFFRYLPGTLAKRRSFRLKKKTPDRELFSAGPLSLRPGVADRGASAAAAACLEGMSGTWWRTARRFLAAAAAVLIAAGTPAAKPAPRRPNIIFISIDTLRPDHAGCYGYSRDTTPNLDAFARDAVIFDNAISAAPWTMPSHMSMFTSLYPNRHGLMHHPKRFDLWRNLKILDAVWGREGWPGLIARFVKEPRVKPRRFSRKTLTLAKVLRTEGYRTGGFTAADALDGGYGFAEGFDIYENEPFRPGGSQNRLALDWVEKAGASPFFLFLHYYDAHGNYGRDLHNPEKMGRYMIYDAPEPHRSLFTMEKRGRFDGTIGSLFALRQHGLLEEADARYLNALYDGGVHYADSHLGAFLESLKKRGLYDDSLILITSDHGEELLKARGEILHNYGLTNTLLRVVFLLKLPGNDLAGGRFVPMVRTIDYLPTVLNAAGISPGRALRAQMQGDSLMEALRKGAHRRIQAYSEVDVPGFAAPLKCIQDSDGWKLLYNPESNETRLYFLGSDSYEKRDISSRHPDRAGRMLEALLEESGMLEPGPPADAGGR